MCYRQIFRIPCLYKRMNSEQVSRKAKLYVTMFSYESAMDILAFDLFRRDNSSNHEIEHNRTSNTHTQFEFECAGRELTM